jgi:putative thioredoxin
MCADAGNIYDVTEREFEARVIGESQKRPVVIDFWSPMCAPCEILGPILERVVDSYGGKVALAKVKVDTSPQLAAAFSVQGVPAVKVIKEGRLVAEFVGARPEEEVRMILDGIVPSEADELTVDAARKAEAGSLDEAEALYRQALAAKPDHPGATIGLAYVAVERGTQDEARRLAGSIEPGTKEKELADALIAQLDFGAGCVGGTERAALEERVAADAGDLDARYELAGCLAAEGGYERALQTLLEIIERDKKYKEGAAKSMMVKIFGIVGKRSELADTYRDKLASLLY